MKNIVLIGASGHGKIAADIALLSGYKNIFFLDSAYPEKTNNDIWSVIGTPEKKYIAKIKDADFFVSIGSNKIRRQIFTELNLTDCPNLFHPTAVVSSRAIIGQGSLFCAGCVVNIGAKIGKFAIINTLASVDHDCVIGDFAHIAPGAKLAGGVSVGENSWVGIGAVIKENIKIGKNVIIGAGSVVIGDVKDNTKIVGVPAKPVRS